MPVYSTRLGLPLGDYIGARGPGTIKTIKADMKKALDNGIDYKTEVNDKLVGELLALINFDAIIDAEPAPVNDEAPEVDQDFKDAYMGLMEKDAARKAG